MKKSLILLVGILFGVSTLFAQTNATDFTADDCHGDEHHLFSELDAGKVIVLAWVMPCGSCIVDPLTAKLVVESYSDILDSDLQKRVLFYLSDDYGWPNMQISSCTTLSSFTNTWDTQEPVTCFSDAAIDMAGYGVPGMPKIVVLAGQNHFIYFNKNSSTTGLSDAIDLALADNPLGINHSFANEIFQLYPNPSVNQLTIELNLAETAQLTIVNLLGETVLSSTFSRETNKQVINTSLWNNGVYFTKLHTEEKQVVQRFVVAH